MTHFAPGAPAGSTFTLALAGIVVRTVKRTFAALKNRRQVAQLYDLDDRTLKDIGLVRSDVQAALGKSLFSDPSHHLMGVAGHKRNVPAKANIPSAAIVKPAEFALLRCDDAALTVGSMKPLAG